MQDCITQYAVLEMFGRTGPKTVASGRKRIVHPRRPLRKSTELTETAALRLTAAAWAACILCRLMELTALQMHTMERLFEAGFRHIAIAPYANAICVHRGEYVAVLGPVENGGLRQLAPATVLVDGNLSVRLKKRTGEVFIFKQKEVPATSERLNELNRFRNELEGILDSRTA